MSICYHLSYVTPVKGELKKKHKAYISCLEAGIEPPKELLVIFGEPSDEKTTREGIEEYFLCLDGESEETIYIDLTKVPENATKIKIVCSY